MIPNKSLKAVLENPEDYCKQRVLKIVLILNYLEIITFIVRYLIKPLIANAMVTYSTYDEDMLVSLLKTGSEEAFTEIYNRFHQPVYGYLLALVKSPEIAEDLLNEIFLKLWEIREKLDIRVSFSAYLFRICHNKAVDATKKIAGDHQLRDELMRYYQDFYSVSPWSREELYQYDVLEEQAFDSLSPQSRKVYELCRLQGKSYREVAEELQISPYTVKEHMSRALANLRSFLKEKGKIALILILLEKIL